MPSALPPFKPIESRRTKKCKGIDGKAEPALRSFDATGNSAVFTEMITHYLKADIIPPYALNKIAVALNVKPTAITNPNLLNKIESIILQMVRNKTSLPKL